MTARLFKAVAGGNDFVVVAAMDDDGWAWSPDETRRACTRRHSVGADGVVVLRRSARASALFELWNSDGSRASFSGNGARCAARALHHLGRSDDGVVSLETIEGIVRLDVGDEDVLLELPSPRNVRLRLKLPLEGGEDCDFAVVGVPYVVTAVSDVDAVDLPRIAPDLRRWHEFPEGANVAVHEPMVAGRPVRLRTWERGIEGETLSSGTGCYAVALSLAARSGHLERGGLLEVACLPRSGRTLTVTLAASGGRVAAAHLRGDARLVAELLVLPEALSGFSP